MTLPQLLGYYPKKLGYLPQLLGYYHILPKKIALLPSKDHFFWVPGGKPTEQLPLHA